jgi:hypothetical protein
MFFRHFQQPKSIFESRPEINDKWVARLWLPEPGSEYKSTRILIRIIATAMILAALLFSHTTYPNLPLFLVGIIALFTASKGMLKYTALSIIFLLIVNQSIELSANTLTEENIRIFQRLSLQIALSIIIFFALLFLPRKSNTFWSDIGGTDWNSSYLSKKLIFYVYFLLYVAPALSFLVFLNLLADVCIRIAIGAEFPLTNYESIFGFKSDFIFISATIGILILILVLISFSVYSSLLWVRNGFFNDFGVLPAETAELTRQVSINNNYIFILYAHQTVGFLVEVAALVWAVYWYFYFSASKDIKHLSDNDNEKYVDGLFRSTIVSDFSWVAGFLLLIHASTLKALLLME